MIPLKHTAAKTTVTAMQERLSEDETRMVRLEEAMGRLQVDEDKKS